MDDSKKKAIMIGVIVVCLVVAATITIKRQRSGGGGVEDIPDSEMTWGKCNNPDCGAEYQIGLRNYFEERRERTDPANPFAVPGLVCKECEEESLFRAEKCEKCGVVFFRGTGRSSGFPDRCTECDFSKMEDIRKKRKEAREAE